MKIRTASLSLSLATVLLTAVGCLSPNSERNNSSISASARDVRNAPVLLDTLETDDPYTRAFAAQALGLIGDLRARPALMQAVEDTNRFVRYHSIRALARMGRVKATLKYGEIAKRDESVTAQFEMRFALKRDEEPELEKIHSALAQYDLKRMDSARLGKGAPDFTLTDAYGKSWTLSQFRGKKSVVLVFLQHSG